MSVVFLQRNSFFCKLTEEHISEEDYVHAQNVWEKFNCQTLGDYHDLYLKTDVLLLSDVFETFRQVCMTNYGLDPAHYYTAPGLSWDAMLKKTGINLELICDEDMFHMVDKGLRGGIAMISNKYAKSNNPYVEGYDSSQPHNYIMYLDANNLYGWAMSQYLPERHFNFMTEQQLEQIDVMSIASDSSTGYIFEVDLKYPKYLHDKHSDYPLAPETLTISEDMLSPYSLNLKKKLNIKGKATPKLVPNLLNKTKYVVHYRNLQFYISQGLQLTKIHRGIEFSQSNWLEPYIRFNTEMRKKARNPFEKDFYKLMNNSVYGKTMENLRKRTDVKLVHTEKRFKKLVAKPSFQRFKIFNEDLTAIHMLQTEIKMYKPTYVGFAVLELSKTLMYNFHYNYILAKYSKAKLLFTDTDSLCYVIETNDIYKDMGQDSDYFDTSDYLEDHFLFSNKNKKVLGKMKDETAGIAIKEFIGLRSKMYSMTYANKEKKTAKGIPRAAMKKQCPHEAYRDCLFNDTFTLSKANGIRVYNHQIYSEEQIKTALSPFDDKRYVLENGYDTLAHGHCGIVS